MIRRTFPLGTPAKLGCPPREIAGTTRILEGGLCKFFCLLDADDHSALRRLRLDVAVVSQCPHPTLDRFPLEASFFLDLSVAHWRPAQHPAVRPRLMCLTKHQPAVEPECSPHPFIMACFEQDPAQARIEIFLTHL